VFWIGGPSTMPALDRAAQNQASDNVERRRRLALRKQNARLLSQAF
jgi:hypothetical protein